MTIVENAVIESAVIDDGERGLLTAWVFLDYGGTSQGFGGYALYLPDEYRHHAAGPNFAGHFIWKVMQIAGVSSWASLPGKTVRVRRESGKILGIGHIVKDQWFFPDEDFKELRAKAGASKGDSE